MSINNITPVIIAKNAEETVGETLKSLEEFSEVILYLNDSSDTTKNIASNFSNVKIIFGEFKGFGPTKNEAALYSTNDWILSLDSDEVIPIELLNEIKNLDLDDEKYAFVLKRDNYFLGKKVKFSGWGQDFLLRIYNKKVHKFNNNMVHEFVLLNTDSKKITLKNSFKHNAIWKISQQLEKMEYYSNLFAYEKKGKKYSNVPLAVLKSVYHFIKIYFFKLGFLDGFAGFMISVSGANGVFYKYIKLYVENKK